MYTLSNKLVFLLFALIMFNSTLPGHASNLGNKADAMKKYVEYFSSINSLKAEIKVINQNLGEEQGCAISIGTYLMHGNIVAFDHTRYFAYDKEQCLKEVESNSNAGYGRTVRTSEHLYSQYGLINTSGLRITPGGADLHPAELIYILELLNGTTKMLDRESNENPQLRDMEPEIVTMPDGTKAEKFQILRFVSNEDYYYSTELYFKQDSLDPLPILYRLSSIIKDKEIKLPLQEISIQTNSSAALGFEQFTFKLYRPENEENINEPNMVLRSQKELVVLSEPQIDIPVYEEDFSFILKAGALVEISHFDKEGESYQVEEDTIITP